MKPSEQDTNRSGNVCFDPDTLFRLAGRTVRMLGIPARWREDAVAEYVLAAYAAGQQVDCPADIQSYQCQLGRRAIIDFARRERRQESLAPAFCSVVAKQVSLDKMIRTRDGELVPMVETIKDVNALQADDRMLVAERREAIGRAVEALDPVARKAVEQVWLEGRTQEEAGKSLGLSRWAVQRILGHTNIRLRERLNVYEDVCKGMRHRKKRGGKKDFPRKSTLRSDYESIGALFSRRPGGAAHA